MTAKKQWHAAWFCTFLGVVFTVWIWRFPNSPFSKNDVTPTRPSVDLDSLTASTALRPDGEIETLREANRKLEEQNQFLVRQLEEPRELARKAQAAAMKKHRASQETEAKLNDVLEPLKKDIQSSTLETEVNSEHTVVTGGFQVSDGVFEYTLTTPTVRVDELGRKVVDLEHKRLAITQDNLERLGLKSLATNANNTLQHGETWSPSQTMDFLAKITAAQGDAEPRGGIDSLAAPRIRLLDGQAGEVQIDTYRAKFKATISDSGHGVRLELCTKQPPLKTQEPQ